MRRPLMALLAMAAALDSCASSPSDVPAPHASAPVADTAWLALTRYKECQGEDPSGRAGRPAIVRYYPTTTDSIHRPFRIIIGASTGLCSPTALAVGPAGELFVLNQAPRAPRPDSTVSRWEQWVTVYDSSAGGDVSPVRVLHVQPAWLGTASSMYVDDEGRLYLGSRAADVIDEGSVAMFEPGADGDAEPSRVIAGAGTGLYRPAAIALDRRGFLYVLNSSDEMPLRYLVRERRTPTGFPAFARKQPPELNAVLVFPPGAAGEVAPARMIAGEQTGLSAPVSLALDRSDHLYVANNLESNGQAAVTVYAPSDTGDAAPVKRLTDPREFYGMGPPTLVALDSHDSVFVASERAGPFRSLTVFAPGDSTQSRSFFRHAPALFALDRHDTVYALERDSVKVFPPGYAGAGDPVRVLTGPQTGIRSVTAMTLDRDGRLYLAVGDSATIRVYPPGAGGGAAPERTIAGPHTKLTRPKGIVVDERGRIYVTNGRRGSGGGGALRIYAEGARGEDQPMGILAAPDNKLPQASDIALDSRGDVYLSSGDEKTGGRILVLRRQGERFDSVRSLSGPSTLLRGPIALTFGRGDTLYALNAFAGYATVTVHVPGAGGDAEPVRVIDVPLRMPPSLFGNPMTPVRNVIVDTTGTVRVLMTGGVLVYPPGAKSPSRETLQQGVEGQGGAVAVGPDGTVYQAIGPVRYDRFLGPDFRMER